MVSVDTASERDLVGWGCMNMNLREIIQYSYCYSVTFRFLIPNGGVPQLVVCEFESAIEGTQYRSFFASRCQYIFDCTCTLQTLPLPASTGINLPPSRTSQRHLIAPESVHAATMVIV